MKTSVFSVLSVVEHLIRITGKGPLKHNITLCNQGYEIKLAGIGCDPNAWSQAYCLITIKG